MDIKPTYAELEQRIRELEEETVGRKRGDKELRKSEERFRRLFEEDLTGNCITTTDGIILECNPAFLQIFGYKNKEEALSDIITVLYPEPSERDSILDQLRQKGKLQNYEAIRKRKDGSFITVNENIVATFDESGKLNEIEAYIYDITEAKRSKEALRESEERFKAQYQGSPTPTFTWQRQGEDLVLIGFNDAAKTITGGKVSDFVGWKATELYTNRQDLVRDLLWCCDERKVVRREAISEHFLPDRLVSGTLAFVPPDLVMVHLEDITDRRQAEEELRASEEKFRASFEGSHDAITITTKDGRLVDCNQRALDMLGLTSKEDFKGRRPVHFSPKYQPDGRESLTAALEEINKVIGGGNFSHFEWLHQRSTGETFPTEITLTSYQLGGETVLQATIRDRTEHKRAEEEREKLQAQLTQAQKMESVGRLAGGVAHDFNNMLGIIIGYAELAAMEIDPDEPLYKSLQEILSASHRSASLVRQLLAFARKQTINPKVLDLNDTVPGMLKMLRRLIREDIELHWIPGKDVGMVRMDPSQVNQVLANLVVNSRDAIPGVGKITIKSAKARFDEYYCRKHAGAVPGEYVLLAVSDTGTGMTPEIMEHLFEPFFTTKEPGMGTGLGLAMVYGVVKQNNGFINVSSEPGHGTTIQIYLPKIESEAGMIPEEVDRAKLPEGTETILLAEDEKALLNITREILERQGYMVMVSRTPTEALSMAEKHQGEIHLLITDVVMPEMNGKELMERLQSLRPGMKGLFMSGYTANVVAHQGVLDEGVHFIEKPFSPKTLVEKVREVLDKG